MLLLDVNVLVDSYHEDATDHADVRSWLYDALAGPEPIALVDLVMSGFVRIVTHPKIFATPSPTPDALSFISALRRQPNVDQLSAGSAWWSEFDEVVRSSASRGNLVTDAHLAALAREHGCTVVSSDRDFARFAGVRWRRPAAD